ncbi:MAG TPA: alpha-amylase family glycosyl hydrolase [Chthoniobacterales bacterium]|nr:alpha-amylase family glycosyl hydrolase [Chthoniobacterales bacterium]
MPGTPFGPHLIAGSDGVSISVELGTAEFLFRYRPAGPVGSALNLFLAIRTQREVGAAVLPFAQHAEGSTAFLPFKADLLLSAGISGAEIVAFICRWERWRWSEREQTEAFEVSEKNGEFVFRIPRPLVGDAATINIAIYAKDPAVNDGWGWFWGCSDRTVDSGAGDKYISHYHEVQMEAEKAPRVTLRNRHGSAESRICIYQLFVRLFGNTNETRKQNGTLADNGVGRFADINPAAIRSIREMGFTHIWLTGVLQQATATDYSEFGQPADDPDLLKGLAGSPYAIKDYFDVCPDYARKPAERLKEFRHLLDRLHAHDLKAIIDLVPNHVARSCDSSVKPDCNFGSCGRAGAGDDVTKFFDPQNNFFYLTPDANGPPLRLPTCPDGVPVSPTCQVPGMKCDGFFEGEKTFGRVTGNNVASWTPHLNDWYETVKLNYGFDFTDPSKSVREYPNAWSPDKPIPDTWKKMDQVIAHWQAVGVDGFRCDMAHMVPPEFWSWVIAQARARRPEVFFIGEAYDDDPSKVPGSDPVVSQLNWGKGNVLFDLLNAGFDAVYDAPAYRALKRIYDGSGWANDIDRDIADDFICHNSVRYAENHDEVRLAAQSEWGRLSMDVGRPVSAILYGLSRGAVMLYNGQEVGEPAAGAEGFGGDDARTSIFDYWSMPELVKWVNDHHYDGAGLSPQQKSLRSFYSRLINLVGEPAFRDGKFFALNPANRDNPAFGRLPGEEASGHWLYAFLRYDPATPQRFLVVANLHPTIVLRDVRILLPENALHFLDLSDPLANPKLKLIEWLSEESIGIRLTSPEAVNSGIPIPEIPPLSAFYFEF